MVKNRGEGSGESETPNISLKSIHLTTASWMWKCLVFWSLSCWRVEAWGCGWARTTRRARSSEEWRCLHRGSSASLGVRLNTPRWGCSGCPTSPGRTVYKGHVGRTGSWEGGGTGTEGCGPRGTQWTKTTGRGFSKYKQSTPELLEEVSCSVSAKKRTVKVRVPWTSEPERLLWDHRMQQQKGAC